MLFGHHELQGAKTLAVYSQDTFTRSAWETEDVGVPTTPLDTLLRGGHFVVCPSLMRDAVELMVILEKLDRYRETANQSVDDLWFLLLPITLGSDHSDLLHDEYQVRMAKPR